MIKFKSLTPDENYKVESMFNVIEETYGINKDMLTSRSRLYHYVLLKEICSNIMRYDFKLGVKMIGAILNLNHSSITRYNLRLDHQLRFNTEFRSAYTTVKKKLELMTLDSDRIILELVELITQRDKISLRIVELGLKLRGNDREFGEKVLNLIQVYKANNN